MEQIRTAEEIAEQIAKLKEQIKNRVGNEYVANIMINILSGRDSATYNEFGKLEIQDNPGVRYFEDNKAVTIRNTRNWLAGQNIELYS